MPSFLNDIIPFILPHLTSLSDIPPLLLISPEINKTIKSNLPPPLLVSLAKHCQLHYPFLQPAPWPLLLHLSPHLTQFASTSASSRATLKRAFQAGPEALLDLLLLPEIASTTGFTLQTLQEMYQFKYEVINPLEDLWDKCVGKQWYQVEGFWEGAREDAVTLWSTGVVEVYQLGVWGALFGRGFEDWLEGENDVVGKRASGLDMRMEYVKYCIPDWRTTLYNYNRGRDITCSYPATPETSPKAQSLLTLTPPTPPQPTPNIYLEISSLDNELDLDNLDLGDTTGTTTEAPDILPQAVDIPVAFRRTRPFTHPLCWKSKFTTEADRERDDHDCQTVILHLFDRSPLFRSVLEEMRSYLGGDFEDARPNEEVDWNGPRVGWRQEAWEGCWVMLGLEGSKMLGEVWRGRKENDKARLMEERRKEEVGGNQGDEAEKAKHIDRVFVEENDRVLGGVKKTLGEGLGWDKLRRWRKLLEGKEKPRSWIVRGGRREVEAFDVPFLLGDLRNGVYEPSRTLGSSD